MHRSISSVWACHQGDSPFKCFPASEGVPPKPLSSCTICGWHLQFSELFGVVVMWLQQKGPTWTQLKHKPCLL